jgi:hypothetical protein
MKEIELIPIWIPFVILGVMVLITFFVVYFRMEKKTLPDGTNEPDYRCSNCGYDVYISSKIEHDKWCMQNGNK